MVRQADLRYTLPFEKPLASIQKQIDELEASQSTTGRDFSDEVANLRRNLEQALRKTYDKLSAWETVSVARHPSRPQFEDYLELFARTDFCELHGDRAFGDDRAIVTGFGRIGGHKALFVGQSKGRDLTERLERNYGCAHPEGYRKALQKMRLAAKFGVPIVTFIDTPGAYPGIGAEERGQSEAIAVNLREMSRLTVPIVSIVIGEGGSGGALGIGVSDRLAMLQYSYYSVISPEGCAGILYKDAKFAPQAAESLKLTAGDLKQLGLMDDILDEPVGGAHRDPRTMATTIEKYVSDTLRDLKRLPADRLLKLRYQRHRNQARQFVVGLAEADSVKAV